MPIDIPDLGVPTRLDRYLKKLFPALTQGILQKALRTGDILVNSKRAKSDLRINIGDQVLIKEPLLVNITKSNDSQKEIHYPLEVQKLAQKLRSEYLLYEDDNLLVINKPARIATQGGSKIRFSIDDAIKYLNQQSEDLRLVHRLDLDTSGILLIAKNYATAIKLTSAFHDKLIVKKYYAMVSGVPKEKNGQISNYISKDFNGAYEVVGENPRGGKLAITNYKVVNTSQSGSMIEFTPLTGRLHQLRFHAKQLGCPVIGDRKYGGLNHPQNVMLLHAASITIPEEILGYKIQIDSELPNYFADSSV